MKLASVKTQKSTQRNGSLCIVSKDNQRLFEIPANIACNMTDALEKWAYVKVDLQKLYDDLNRGAIEGSYLDMTKIMAPITNAPGFYDGSAYLSHVYRARKARGDELPATAKTIPLMYQGVSDHLLPSRSALSIMDESFGGDFEAELAVITTEVRRGSSVEEAGNSIALVTLFNDITYRELLKKEIEFKFGFLQSKPNSAFAPFAVTLDELGSKWQNGKPDLKLLVSLNGEVFGRLDTCEMHFSFPELVAHAALTRPLSCGNIIGGGTISNEDKDRGFACLTEKRYQEVLDNGKPTTPWLTPGDHISMDVSLDGMSVFGSIEQLVTL